MKSRVRGAWTGLCLGIKSDKYVLRLILGDCHDASGQSNVLQNGELSDSRPWFFRSDNFTICIISSVLSTQTYRPSLRLRHHLSIPIYVSISGLFYMVCTTPSIIRNINLIPYWKSSHIIASIAYERCFPFESYQCRYKIYNNGKSRFQLSLFILNKNPTQKHTLCINLQKHFKRDRLPHCSSLMF